MVKELIKKAKNIFFTNPELLYREELALINQPFYFEGTNGKAVLLIHGWTSTPYEVRRLGKYLNENGYTVHAPMLKGHGTVPKDLEEVRWQDWLDDTRTAYQELKKKYARVFVGGTSIGSNLAVLLASQNPDVSGLVLMAAPYKIKFERLAILGAKIFGCFKKYNRKFYPPTFGVSTTITRLISYQSYPIKSSLEIFDLVQKARSAYPFVKQPCLVMQSSSDHVVKKNSLENIYATIKSPVKKKIYIKRAYHTFISDIKNEHVFEEIRNFLNEN